MSLPDEPLQIHDVEQGTEEWFHLRAGRPTASEFHQLVTPKGNPSVKAINSYAAELAAELYVGKPVQAWDGAFKGNAHTDRGNELEPTARAIHSFELDQDVEQIGFITRAGVGCSPDGVIWDGQLSREGLKGDVAYGLEDLMPPLPDWRKNGGAEYKCFSHKNHVLALRHWHTEQTCPPEQYAQVQGQLLVTGWAWIELFYYSQNLPGLTIRVHPNEDYQQMLVQQIELVLEQRDTLLEMLREI